MEIGKNGNLEKLKLGKMKFWENGDLRKLKFEKWDLGKMNIGKKGNL